MMQIEFARGDSYQRGFIVKRGGPPVAEAFDHVYFTVKKFYADHDYIFQKNYDNGGITYDGGGHYTIIIEPEDTNELAFGEYDFDIELKNDDGYKRTFSGKLKLAKETTHYYNE